MSTPPTKKRSLEKPVDRCLLIHPSEDTSLCFSWVPADLVTPEVAEALKKVEDGLALFWPEDPIFTPEELERGRADLPDCLKPLWGQIHEIEGEHWGGELFEGYSKVLTMYTWC